MKKALTFAVMFALLFAANFAQAQSTILVKQAENQSREMADRLKLNEAEYLKVKQFNFTRLQKIADLGNLREQDSRYLDMRLDQIEEEYSSMVYNTLSPKQYKAFANYRKDQPSTYAGVVNQTQGLKNAAIAIAAE